MNNRETIEILKTGHAATLSWLTRVGDVGLRIWVDSSDNAVFTWLDSGINEQVIPLENIEEIDSQIDYYKSLGYGK